jgi:photosynthetic reaction center cytochrome c subunit
LLAGLKFDSACLAAGVLTAAEAIGGFAVATLMQTAMKCCAGAERTYAPTINMSEALGVNCNFCHVTRTFGSWAASTPQRVTAWQGIRMARDLNKAHLDPLKSVLPANRLSKALGDAPKVSCATCHNGVHKPLLGAQMVRDFPELIGAAAPASPAAQMTFRRCRKRSLERGLMSAFPA